MSKANRSDGIIAEYPTTKGLGTFTLYVLRFAEEHNHTPTALRLECGLYNSNIDYKA